MSRVGKMPIEIPSGTKVKVEDGVFTAQGPKGAVSEKIVEGTSVEVNGGVVSVKRQGDSGPDRARHGLMRALLSNAVEGVSRGFSKVLEINGVGYRAQLKGKQVHLSLGYSHPIVFPVPEGVAVEVEERTNRITVSGPNRQQVGQIAAEIRSLRKPEPYKGKGIRYAGEVVRRKVGKAGAK